jgi:hypothetical protein
MIVLVAMLALPFAKAALQPRFNLEGVAWHSTEVVIATEGDTIDGELTVVEPLVGKLGHGDAISIAELAQFSTANSRTVYRCRGPSQNPPLVVDADRMVLFLKLNVLVFRVVYDVGAGDGRTCVVVEFTLKDFAIGLTPLRVAPPGRT